MPSGGVLSSFRGLNLPGRKWLLGWRSPNILFACPKRENSSRRNIKIDNRAGGDKMTPPSKADDPVMSAVANGSSFILYYFPKGEKIAGYESSGY